MKAMCNNTATIGCASTSARRHPCRAVLPHHSDQAAFALPILSERKNCNLPGVLVDLPTITEKDVDDLLNWVRIMLPALRKGGAQGRSANRHSVALSALRPVDRRAYQTKSTS